jgi:hypothetical protein
MHQWWDCSLDIHANFLLRFTFALSVFLGRTLKNNWLDYFLINFSFGCLSICVYFQIWYPFDTYLQYGGYNYWFHCFWILTFFPFARSDIALKMWPSLMMAWRGIALIVILCFFQKLNGSILEIHRLKEIFQWHILDFLHHIIAVLKFSVLMTFVCVVTWANIKMISYIAHCRLHKRRLFLLVTYMVMPILALAVPCYIHFNYSPSVVLYGVLAVANIFSMLCTAWGVLSLMLLLLWALLFAHRVLWQMFNRPIYAMARHKLVYRHKTLVCVGTALLVISYPPSAKFFRALLELIH